MPSPEGERVSGEAGPGYVPAGSGQQPDSSGQAITIAHLEVYNFPGVVEGPWSLGQGRTQSPCWTARTTSSSSGPICRICHEGDASESLLAPCNCSGTMGMVHLSCMERWLSSTETDSCELCHFKFKTRRAPRPFYDFVCHWMRSPSSPTQQRSMIGDMVCFFLLTPIAVASVFLCLDGALQQFLEGSQMEAGCLLGLSAILATIYIVWMSVTIRYYYRNYRRWQQTNQEVHILPRHARTDSCQSPCPAPGPNSGCGSGSGPDQQPNESSTPRSRVGPGPSPSLSVFTHTPSPGVQDG